MFVAMFHAVITNKPNPHFPVYLQTSEDFSFASAALLYVPWKRFEFAQTAFF